MKKSFADKSRKHIFYERKIGREIGAPTVLVRRDGYPYGKPAVTVMVHDPVQLLTYADRFCVDPVVLATETGMCFQSLHIVAAIADREDVLEYSYNLLVDCLKIDKRRARFLLLERIRKSVRFHLVQIRQGNCPGKVWDEPPRG